jgi:hypothetical protein
MYVSVGVRCVVSFASSRAMRSVALPFRHTLYSLLLYSLHYYIHCTVAYSLHYNMLTAL